ncbi:phosphatase PAP2 family protein [uncultured Sphingomonas sp.]|uniref:phosphatase PAP2 family protein n=1 Tax=uncultured Sphingomonas sp. TaxID=158754 RepID=UPI0035CC34AD
MTDTKPAKKSAKARMKSDKKPAKARAKAAKKAIAKADVGGTHAAAAARNTPVMRVVAGLAEVADQPPLIVASLGTLVIGLVTRRRDLARGGARMLAAHLLATAAKLAVKHQFDRTRPSHALDGDGHRFEAGDEGGHEDKSFPSGHTAGAVAVARAASRDIDGAAVPAMLAAGAAAAAQAPAGNHYFSDVIAGAAIGWASEAVVSAVFDRLEPRVEAAFS